MYRLLRNTHLALGLGFFLIALVFAASSLFIMYRPFLPEQEVRDSERVIQLEAGRNPAPRDLALQLMTQHGLSGDLRQIEETPETVSFRVFRPGTEVRVSYDRSSGAASIKSRRYDLMETLIQLHVNHGFWHDFIPSNLWSLLSVLASAGLLLLGVTGLYLTFRQRREWLIGGILVAISLIYAVTALVLSRG